MPRRASPHLRASASIRFSSSATARKRRVILNDERLADGDLVTREPLVSLVGGPHLAARQAVDPCAADADLARGRGRSIARIALPAVDLPQPLSPTRPRSRLRRFRRRCRRGDRAGDFGKRRALTGERGTEPRHRVQEALGIGWSGRRNNGPTGASSAFLPAYIMTTRSRHLGDHARDRG